MHFLPMKIVTGESRRGQDLTGNFETRLPGPSLVLREHQGLDPMRLKSRSRASRCRQQ
jgi:hypothetical protein